MKDKKIMLLVVLILVAVALLVVGYLKVTSTTSSPDGALDGQEVSSDDPLDIVSDFYGEWLDTVRSNSTDPQQLGLAQNPILSQELRTKLTEVSGEEEIDPVLCQNPIPEKVNSKSIFSLPDQEQFIVFSKDQREAGQAVVTLQGLNDGWFIQDITCSLGESGVEREFTFEFQGNLLKSVPPPYDPNLWHLVYTRDDVPGHAIPLFFNTENTCTDISGSEATCDEGQFIDAQKVMLRGNMTEAGVEVKQIEFIE